MVKTIKENDNTDEMCKSRSGRKVVPPKDYKPSMLGQRHDKSFGMIVEHIFTQCSLKAGERKFGREGSNAAQKEMDQLHHRVTFKPVSPADSDPRAKRKALESLIFLKEKRHGTIKGSTCADGRKQREDMPKGGSTSPTVSLESVLTTSTTDAKEGRDVAVVDVHNALIQTKMDDDEAVMKLRGD